MGRSFTATDGYTYGIAADSISRISINDIGTLRARAGYGRCLPAIYLWRPRTRAGGYRANTRVHGTGVNVNAAPGFQNVAVDLTETEMQKSHLLYGYSAGLGVDVSLMAGLFLRAEWEYIRFTSAVDTNVNTVRAGLGYKF